MPTEPSHDAPALGRLAADFLRLGAFGSGGPIARRAIVDVPAALLAVATLAVVTWLKRLPEPLVILAAGAVGFALWRAR